jgi:hypothetical protein
MWKKCCVSVVLAALTVVSLPARAQDADNIADVRCVAVGIRFAVTPDSTQKSIGTLIILYYLGRLDGRAPTLDVEKLLTAQIAKMTDADYTAEAMRCNQNLTAKGAQITHLGEDMQKYFKGPQR